MNPTSLSFKDASLVNAEVWHHLRTGNSVVPQIFFSKTIFLKVISLTKNVNYNTCVLRKPFSSMLRHKPAYEQDLV